MNDPRPFQPGDQVYPNAANRHRFLLQVPVPDAYRAPGVPLGSDVWLATDPADSKLCVIFLHADRSIHVPVNEQS